jgi:ABC-type glycerol-3-phosphate transport system substrate-binding protein
MKTTLLALATALLLAACGGGDPLPDDCVPASFVGPLPEGQVRCEE